MKTTYIVAPPSGSEPLTGRLPWAAAEAGWDRSRPGCMHAGRVRSRLNLPAERVTLIVKERFKSASSYACYSQRYRDQGMLQISSDENGVIDAIGEKNSMRTDKKAAVQGPRGFNTRCLSCQV